MRPIFPESHYVERIEDLLRIHTGTSAGPVRERARSLLIEILEEEVRLILDLDCVLAAAVREGSIGSA